MDKQTTAELRTQAWEAEQQRDWARAAELYQAALDAYPATNPKSALANADREGLRRKARSCRTMVVRTEGLCDGNTYRAAIQNLRELLAQIGRAEFRAYGYAQQLRQYRRATSGVAA